MWHESKIWQISATEGLIHLLCQAAGEGTRQSLFPVQWDFPQQLTSPVGALRREPVMGSYKPVFS